MQEEELRKLFNEGITGQFGKKKTQASDVAEKLGLTEVNQNVADLLETFSSDSSDDEEEKKYSRNETYYVNTTEPEATEIFREKTLEDMIEEQRAKLAAEGKKGTPVTEESFTVWRAEKLKKRQELAEARLKAEQQKKKGGKGLCKCSSRYHYTIMLTLFTFSCLVW